MTSNEPQKENSNQLEKTAEKNSLNESAALESLLFIYGEPVTLKKISKLLDVAVEEAAIIVENLETRLKNDSGRGLTVIRNGDEIQLGTKPDFHKLGEKIIKEELKENLTPAALETLALVAYAGPLARSRIDYLRGVNSSYIIRNLLVRGIVERSPAPERPSIYLYRLSFNALKHLGLNHHTDLPDYQKYKEMLNNFDAQTQ